MNPIPVTLEGTHVRLEPLARAHADDLFAAAQFDEIWEYFLQPRPATREQMRAWVDSALAQVAAGAQVWFAILHRADACAIGVTAYLNIARGDHTLEIGGTWLTPAAWRTPINTECKYLLLRHAFENLGCRRVQLKTDERNTRSRRAIERLGAVPEGILRKYQARFDGYQRNTAMYSIIDTEWQTVRARLEKFLAEQR